MKYLLIYIVVFVFLTSSKTKADETISSHTMGHIIGGLGSFFLGPLPGLGLSILPEAISILSNDESGSPNTSKQVFYVNEYTNEFEIVPYHEKSSDDMITKYENTVKLTNSLKYY